jgi:hypothetical protein
MYPFYFIGRDDPAVEDAGLVDAALFLVIAWACV